MKFIIGIYRAAIKQIVILTAVVFPSVVLAVSTTEVKGFYFIGKNTNVSFSNNSTVDSADLVLDIQRNTIENNNFLLLKGPGEKIITLTNDQGNSFQINIRPRIYIEFSAQDGQNNAWFDLLKTASSGCANSSAGVQSGRVNFYFTSEADLNCTIPDTGALSSSGLHYTRIAFPLKTSRTVTPPTVPGLYRGTVSYSVGPASEVSFGPAADYNISSIEIPIVVEVTDMEHRVTFPPGADLAVLIPAGGWAHWINSGKRPDSISRDIPFTINSAGLLSIVLADCSYSARSACQIASAEGDLASLSIGVTLPPPWRNMTQPGFNVVNTIILPDSHSLKTTVSTQFQVVRNSRGTIKVEVKGADLEKMLAKPGSTWTGNVTLLFEKDAYD